MNILIPLCGKGERFQNVGYANPKPLINIFDKPIIQYVLDSINCTNNDTICIIYHKDLDQFNFTSIVQSISKNKIIHFIALDIYTKGAAETLKLGINALKNSTCFDVKKPIACYDCDTFYTIDTLSLIKQSIVETGFKNNIITFPSTDPNPIFSYVRCNSKNQVLEIAEKRKISDHANSGIYCFESSECCYTYACQIVDDENKYMNNECYISCIIKEMLNQGIIFQEIQIKKEDIVSLGTPKQVFTYIDEIKNIQKQVGFCFDLDGTLVLTDEIYVDVWRSLLKCYHIDMNKDMFNTYIQGHNDTYVVNALLPHIKDIDEVVKEISLLKDKYFMEQIKHVKVIKGVQSFLQSIKHHPTMKGKIAIITNCNRQVAELILKTTHLDCYIDYLVIGNECTRTKPYPDPYCKAINELGLKSEDCFIFEDSKTGLLSCKSLSPKALIAVQHCYSNETYQSLNVSRVIHDFTEISVDDCLSLSFSATIILENYIKTSCIQSNAFPNQEIEQIIIDDSKLKGGYITDAMKCKIKTSFHTYECVLKIENKEPTVLTKMANMLGLFEREYYFYETLSSIVPIHIPKFYCIVKDNEDQTIGILLENLFTLGCELNIDLNQSSIETILQVINDCSKLHATFWNKTCFKQLKYHNDPVFQPGWKTFLNQHYDCFKKKWNMVLKPYQVKCFDWAVENFITIQVKLSTGCVTLCHGDVKSPNLFYLRNQSKITPYFIDWQYIAYGKGVQDIVFFMIESFNLKKTKEIVRLVKDYYYIKLVENGVIDYSLEDYNQDFITSIFHFPLFVAIWFGTLDEEDLIDKNFPFFFIQKLLHFIDCFKQECLDIFN